MLENIYLYAGIICICCVYAGTAVQSYHKINNCPKDFRILILYAKFCLSLTIIALYICMYDDELCYA